MYHYASTGLKSYSYKISYHKFILFHYEIKFPCQYIQCPSGAKPGEGHLGHLPPQKNSKHCIAILTFAETFKE